jgi:putative membrane protein
MRRLTLSLAAALALGVTGAGGTAVAHDHSSHAKRFSAWDEQWLMTSIAGDRFEIAGGKLAQSKGASDPVRALGARLVTDHTKSLNEAIAVAKQLGIDVPDSPTPSEQWELAAVQTFSGKAFDQQYASLEVKDHDQDIQETKDEISKGTNKAIRALARTDLPTLKEHRRLSKAALQAVGG